MRHHRRELFEPAFEGAVQPALIVIDEDARGDVLCVHAAQSLSNLAGKRNLYLWRDVEACASRLGMR